MLIVLHRVLEPEKKVGIYVDIAQLYLEDDESVQAEAYINRGNVILETVGYLLMFCSI